MARAIPSVVYDLLFHTAADMLKAYGHKYLGGEMGFTMVLHTWSQKMTKHIHVHCIVWGGTLGKGKRGRGSDLQKEVSVFGKKAFQGLQNEFSYVIRR